MFRFIAALGVLSIAFSSEAAMAKGRLAGAAVGGVVGAKSHHAVAGAVVGGAVGHHMAKTHDRKAAAAAGAPK
jgi:uncharacterized protein YcfJ